MERQGGCHSSSLLSDSELGQHVPHRHWSPCFSLMIVLFAGDEAVVYPSLVSKPVGLLSLLPALLSSTHSFADFPDDDNRRGTICQECQGFCGTTVSGWVSVFKHIQTSYLYSSDSLDAITAVLALCKLLELPSIESAGKAIKGGEALPSLAASRFCSPGSSVGLSEDAVKVGSWQCNPRTSSSYPKMITIYNKMIQHVL